MGADRQSEETALGLKGSFRGFHHRRGPFKVRSGIVRRVTLRNYYMRLHSWNSAFISQPKYRRPPLVPCFPFFSVREGAQHII